MTARRQWNASGQPETKDTDYPRFEAWQRENKDDKYWCLNITQNAHQEPIEIRELPSLKAVEKLITGFLGDADSKH